MLLLSIFDNIPNMGHGSCLTHTGGFWKSGDFWCLQNTAKSGDIKANNYFTSRIVILTPLIL